jgi:hypothetical protein
MNRDPVSEESRAGPAMVCSPSPTRLRSKAAAALLTITKVGSERSSKWPCRL